MACFLCANGMFVWKCICIYIYTHVRFPRWWFQISLYVYIYMHMYVSPGGGNSNIFGMFTPICEEMIQFDVRIFFRWGWLKPPTSHSLFGPVGLFVKDKPLVIPEINGDGLVSEPLIANPNCTTAVGAMALWPIHQKYKLKKVPDLHFFLDRENHHHPKVQLVELRLTPKIFN